MLLIKQYCIGSITGSRSVVHVRGRRYLKALSHYNVLANVCRRMKNISSTLAYAEIELKNQRKPLSELIQSVC